MCEGGDGVSSWCEDGACVRVVRVVRVVSSPRGQAGRFRRTGTAT